MARAITLTITRPYLEVIYQGFKDVEYRRDISYYDDLFSTPVDWIYFHYRQGIYLKCSILKIKKIEKPQKLFMSQFITTPKCWAIHMDLNETEIFMSKKDYEKDVSRYKQ